MTRRKSKQLFWIDYWGLGKNPFFLGELAHSKSEDFGHRFVYTPAVKDMDTLYEEIKRASHGGAFLIQGDIGSGKSTLLNYLIRNLFEEMQSVHMVPVYLKFKKTEEVTNSAQLWRKIETDLCLTLTELPFSKHLFRNNDPLEIDPKLAHSLLLNAIKQANVHDIRFCFLIDEVDKVDKTIVTQYLRDYQPAAEELFLDGNFVIWTAHLDWNIFDMYPNFYIKPGVTIRRWPLESIEELLQKRVSLYRTKRKESLEVFTKDAIKEIYFISHGSPRRSQILAEASMRLGAAYGAGMIDKQTVRNASENETDANIYNAVAQLVFNSSTTKEVFCRVINLFETDIQDIDLLLDLFDNGLIASSSLSSGTLSRLERFEKESVVKKIRTNDGFTKYFLVDDVASLLELFSQEILRRIRLKQYDVIDGLQKESPFKVEKKMVCAKMKSCFKYLIIRTED